MFFQMPPSLPRRHLAERRHLSRHRPQPQTRNRNGIEVIGLDRHKLNTPRPARLDHDDHVRGGVLEDYPPVQLGEAGQGEGGSHSRPPSLACTSFRHRLQRAVGEEEMLDLAAGAKADLGGAFQSAAAGGHHDAGAVDRDARPSCRAGTEARGRRWTRCRTGGSDAGPTVGRVLVVLGRRILHEILVRPHRAAAAMRFTVIVFVRNDIELAVVIVQVEAGRFAVAQFFAAVPSETGWESSGGGPRERLDTGHSSPATPVWLA